MSQTFLFDAPADCQVCQEVGPPLVKCAVCRRSKKPLGRDGAGDLCDSDCPGYSTEPHASELWPGEVYGDSLGHVDLHTAAAPPAPGPDPSTWREVPSPPGAPAVPYRVKLQPPEAEWYCQKTGEWRRVGDPGLVGELVGTGGACTRSATDGP